MIEGVVTVKVVDAVSPETVPTLLPDAITVFAPVVDEGTVKVQLNAPATVVVWEVHVWVAGVAPLKVKVLMGVDTENPLPVTVTLLPTRPCVGDRVIVGVVTVNVADFTTEPSVYTIT